jgi:peptidyl-prolyl cis-trans isomerase D
MRSFTRSWVSYLLLFVLAGAFAIWGINDVFRGVGAQNVAEVSGHEITPAMLTRELELTLEQQRNDPQHEGPEMTQQEAVDQGIHLQLLEGMIGRFALYGYAEKLGVSASDAQVASRIRSIPAVMNPVTNRFDESAYDAFLQRLRYSRAEFEQNIRGDLTRDMLVEALMIGIHAPSSYGALFFTYETETRTISIAEAPASIVGAVSPPTAAQLQTFYQENQDRLRVPEYRALTLVYARPSDFAARVDVPEARLREEYEARRAAISQPERRSYIRINAANQAQANDIAARLNRGEAPEAVAAALHTQVNAGQNEARTEVPDAGVAEAVFAIPPRAPARAVQGRLTPWVVVRVDAVTPAVEPSFESQREQLRAAIAADEAADLLNAAVTAFEDARSAGSAVADAARQAGLAVVSVPAVDAQGRDPHGQASAAVTGQQELLRTAFQTAESEASEFMPVTDADVLVSVDRITPSTVRPLSEVREQLSQLWVVRERVRRRREAAEQVASDVRGGQSFAAAVRARGFRMAVTSQPIDRRTAAQVLTQDLAVQIFSGREGDVANEVRGDGGAVRVAMVEHINRIDAAEHPREVQQARLGVQQSVAQSLGEALQAEIVEQAHPRRNERLLNQVYRRGNGEGGEAQAQ